MPLFTYPRAFYGPAETSFHPLFRLLDDFESLGREAQSQGCNAKDRRHHQRQSLVRTFTPRFDVRETDAAYELHGELPGIDRDQIEIEFADPQTLVVRGRIERSYTAGTPPAAANAAVEDADASKKAITEEADESAAQDFVNVSHKATVEDEPEENTANTAEKESDTSVVSQQAAAPAEATPEAQTPADKFWVAERSVGQFSRTFNLAARVDQDGVSASLNNGILTVVVPKAKKHEARRIAIN